MKSTLPSIASEEQPQERCLLFGPNCLSIRECLAILVESGPTRKGSLKLAAQILSHSGEGLNPKEELRAFFTAMEGDGPSFLKDCLGLSRNGQAKILAAFEIGRRYALYRNQVQTPCRPWHSLPQLAKRALEQVPHFFRMEVKEWIGFVAIYRSGEIGALSIVEKGIRTHVNFDPADLFARILALRPQGYYLFHHHPSGNPTPSCQDLELTQKVGEISKLFQIQLLGHWIVAGRGEYWIGPI